MAASIGIGKTNSIAGKSFNEQTTLNAGSSLYREETVAAAQTGVLTTRTSDTAGSITMDSASHTITDGDRIDIFFVGGVSFGATVGTVAGTVVPFTLAEGDVLPSASTAVSVSLPKKVDFDVDGANIKALVFATAQRGKFVLTGSDSATDYARTVKAAKVDLWYEDLPDVNPIAGDVVAFAFLSHGEATTVIMKLAALFD